MDGSSTPFIYAPFAHSRRHAPASYKDYRDFKPWLRDEFVFRSVYRLEREMWYPDRADSFSVDHVTPRQGENGDSSLECTYSNLVYACTRCNSLKQGLLLLDPTKQAMGVHIQVDPEGNITGPTRRGKILICQLRLDVEPALSVRKYGLELIALKTAHPDEPRVDCLFIDQFRYPNDLPDLLKLKPPGGNVLKKNSENSHFARRDRDVLPEVY